MKILDLTYDLQDNYEWRVMFFIMHVRKCLENSHIIGMVEEGMKEFYTIKELSLLLDIDYSGLSKTINNLEKRKLIKVVEDNKKTTRIVMVNE